jgi:hypothetical protein
MVICSVTETADAFWEGVREDDPKAPYNPY